MYHGRDRINFLSGFQIVDRRTVVHTWRKLLTDGRDKITGNPSNMQITTISPDKSAQDNPEIITNYAVIFVFTRYFICKYLITKNRVASNHKPYNAIH